MVPQLNMIIFLNQFVLLAEAKIYIIVLKLDFVTS